MYVFVVTASWISEHTLMSEVMGVYAHMHQTIHHVGWLRDQGKHALVTKHEVTGFVPVAASFQIPEQLQFQLNTEGVQTDPSVGGSRS